MKEKLVQKEETSAEQRQRLMNKDERALQARDLVARDIHQQAMRDGRNTTFEQAQRKASQIAERASRDEK